MASFLWFAPDAATLPSHSLRQLYHAMRYRKGGLYMLYQLETVVIFFVSCYMIFSVMGNMTQASHERTYSY